MSTETLQETLARFMGSDAQHAIRTLGNDLLCTLPAERLLEAAQALAALPEYHHLSTITGVLGGDGVRVLYHFWLGRGVTLEVLCQKEGADLPSLTPQMPAADWYEREVHEMFGVQFVGHPNLKPLFLPDDWVEGPPMLAQEEAG